MTYVRYDIIRSLLRGSLGVLIGNTFGVLQTMAAGRTLNYAQIGMFGLSIGLLLVAAGSYWSLFPLEG